MTTFVALLRAVNVGTVNRIKMTDLRAGFLDAGFADAVTHIQSGNVIFSSSAKASLVKQQIEALLTDRFGLSITAIIRSAGELAAVAESNPFIELDETDITKLYVAFLNAAPTAAAVETFLAAPMGGDQVVVRDREVFIRYDVGAGTTKLTPAVWNKLGVEATARNWNVTTTLARMAAEHGR